MSTSNPLVSIVTPVYNGEKYLSECIESVLSQSFKNWEYIIVNNCSTDRTLEIAQIYAGKDPRIKVSTNENFLDLMPNWNHALRQISEESKYCKVVHADDLLLPECIDKMVMHAEQYPTVGIIGSYYLKGNLVQGTGIPYPKSVISGQEIFIATLRKDYYVFGSPTSTLIRSDIVRESKNFYNEDNYHADVEACLDILREYDFGFVHQILSYTRLHDDTQTFTRAEKLNTNMLENFKVFLKYGPIYFDDVEYEAILKMRLKKYKAIFSKSFLYTRNKDYFEYHKKGLGELGISIGVADLVRTALTEVVDKAFNPKRTIEQLIKRL